VREGGGGLANEGSWKKVEDASSIFLCCVCRTVIVGGVGLTNEGKLEESGRCR
jgi:hypothetical protein